VGKTFLLTLAVGMLFGFSFAYILMATTRSLEDFSFLPVRYSGDTDEKIPMLWSCLHRRMTWELHW
jgi:hypothetical protein